MKKKWLLGLGTIAAIAAPVVGLISCGDKDPLVNKKDHVYPFEVKKNNKDFDILKSMKTNGKELSEKDATKILEMMIPQNKNIFLEWKAAFPKQYPNEDNVSKSKFKIKAKIIKGFLNNKIIIEFKIEEVATPPKIIVGGIATKTIEIIFATALIR